MPRWFHDLSDWLLGHISLGGSPSRLHYGGCRKYKDNESQSADSDEAFDRGGRAVRG